MVIPMTLLVVIPVQWLYHVVIPMTYQWFIIPDTAASVISQVGIVAAFTPGVTVGVVPHLP